MKRIILKNIKEVLKKLEADKSTTELILNNVDLYNDLIKEYKTGSTKDRYLMYQLNNQIIKQIEAIKKINISKLQIEGKYNNNDIDPFAELKLKIEKLGKNDEQRNSN